MKWIGRLALALLSLLVLARAAAAQPYEPAYVEGQGYEYGYEAGSQSSSYEQLSYQSDRYGQRGEQASGGAQSSYEYGYGSAYEHRSGDETYDQGYAVAESCDWTRPADPRDPYACPPGWGVVTLPGSFFYGGGGVGPEYIAGGGGGGGGYVYAGAGASAYAYASASARVSIGGGRGKGGHRPPKRGGCGCR